MGVSDRFRVLSLILNKAEEKFIAIVVINYLRPLPLLRDDEPELEPELDELPEELPELLLDPELELGVLTAGELLLLGLDIDGELLLAGVGLLLLVGAVVVPWVLVPDDLAGEVLLPR